MAKANYRPAEEVRKIAEDLIPKYHQHLVDYSVKLVYNFIDKTPKSKGMEVWGTCRKISGLNAYLANGQDGTFFCITISEPIWDVLPPEARIALVDHELCHAWAEADQKEESDGSEDVVKFSSRPHDLEEFCCIVRRHGLWRDNVKDFVDAALKKREKE